MDFFRTDSNEPDFLKLVALLDAELAERDGDDHAFYSLYNKLDQIENVVVCRRDTELVGCGGLKNSGEGELEIKRMYVNPAMRGQGIATEILIELEKWAVELGCRRIVLETGKRQPEAIRLYQKCGYRQISNYGPYEGIENSVCFEKVLSDDQGDHR